MLDTRRPDEVAAPPPARPTRSPASSPAAARIPVARWRDARLLIGVLLVVLSVLLGGRVVASADRTVAMPVTSTDVAAGMHVSAAGTEYREVRLDGDHPYLVGPVPEGSVALRDLSAGELIPRDAIGPAPAEPASVRYVTVPVPADQVPDGLGPGDLVDVYVTGDAADAAGSTGGQARLVAAGVAVEGMPEDSSAFGVAGDSQRVTLVLARTRTESAFQALVATVVGAGRAGEVVLVGAPRTQP
jgi:hypothetical protein